MRSVRFGLLLCLLLFNVSLWAQEPASSQRFAAPIPAPKDPQAVSVVNQALAVAGGVQAIAAIADYTATGNIVYNGNPNEQGSVTLQGLGLIAFRLDANLPSGVRSLAIDGGEITQKAEDGTVSQPHTQAPMFPGSFALPYLHLASALGNPRFSIAYEGLVQIDGHSAHEIRVQLVMPQGIDPQGLTTAFHTRDFFIDATTFQVLMTQESFGRKRILRQVRYSDYKLVNGFLAPFSISEELVALRRLDIHFDQITFNTGLQESAFVL